MRSQHADRATGPEGAHLWLGPDAELPAEKGTPYRANVTVGP
ncbi:hypothetical protein NRF20_19195 [Streptomyces sp. R-74717]